MPSPLNKLNSRMIVADARGRVNLGSDAVGKTFAVNRTADGEFSLVPMIAVPEREAWLWQNGAARASFETGLEQARTGQGKSMDFSAYLENDAEESK